MSWSSFIQVVTVEQFGHWYYHHIYRTSTKETDRIWFCYCHRKWKYKFTLSTTDHIVWDSDHASPREDSGKPVWSWSCLSLTLHVTGRFWGHWTGVERVCALCLNISGPLLFIHDLVWACVRRCGLTTDISSSNTTDTGGASLHPPCGWWTDTRSKQKKRYQHLQHVSDGFVSTLCVWVLGLQNSRKIMLKNYFPQVY